jgi:hypothetical protein
MKILAGDLKGILTIGKEIQKRRNDEAASEREF